MSGATKEAFHCQRCCTKLEENVTLSLPFSLLSPMCLSHGSQLTQKSGKATQRGRDKGKGCCQGMIEILVQGRGIITSCNKQVSFTTVMLLKGFLIAI